MISTASSSVNKSNVGTGRRGIIKIWPDTNGFKLHEQYEYVVL